MFNGYKYHRKWIGNKLELVFVTMGFKNVHRGIFLYQYDDGWCMLQLKTAHTALEIHVYTGIQGAWSHETGEKI